MVTSKEYDVNVSVKQVKDTCESETGKHTGSIAGGAVGPTDWEFVMYEASSTALSWSITSLGGGRGFLRW